MRYLFLFWFLLCGSSWAASALIGHNGDANASSAESLPAEYQGPVRIDLSGAWDFRLDPNAQGEGEAWFAPDTRGAWEKAAVPGSYDVQFSKDPNHPDPGDTYLFYKGKAWYRTRFQSPRTANDLFLHLSGTVLRQKMWVNGHLIGSSALPWLNVAYDVSGVVTRGAENTLVIEVDNSILPDAIPDAKWRGWWDDGGLIWPVYLEERPPVRAQSFTSTAMEGRRWRLTLETRVHKDSPKAAHLEFILSDRNGKTIWRKVEKAPAEREAEIHGSVLLSGIQEWSPEHPTLYRLTVKTNAAGQAADVISFRIGFRQIEVKGSQVLLNGEPIELRGVNRHEFALSVGQTMSAAQNRQDMQDIKALGANFVRLTHYSQSQDVYDDCDELGLLVWTEIPAWQSAASTLSSPTVWKDYAAPQLEQMVEQHRNHPSVIIWSVANEIPSDKPEVSDYVFKAIHYVHQLDPSRLATFASDKRERDISMGPADLIAVNEYYGWYYGNLDDVGPMLDAMHAKYPEKPILVSEFGSEAVAQWNPAAAKAGSKDYSYQNQARFLSSQLRQIYAPERRGYVAGGAIWVYNDFPDPHRIGGDHPDDAKYRNSKGLVTMDREPKPAYDVVKAFYRGLLRDSEESAAR